MKEYLPIIDTGKCETCTHYSFKIVYGNDEATQGKCFGWRDYDVEHSPNAIPPSEDEPEGWAPSRWTTSTDTCERYEFDRQLGENHARHLLCNDLVARIGIANWRTVAAKSFDEMSRMMRELESAK